MLRKFKLAIFVFRRDHRLYDNTGLIEAVNCSEKVIPCFIFDPKQTTSQNQYFAKNCFQFMLESLKDLEGQLAERKGKLYLLQGSPHDTIEKIVKKTKADAVIVNEDYTPYSIERDKLIKQSCDKLGVSFLSFEDLLLVGLRSLPEDFPKYKVFTPYYKRMSLIPVPKPRELPKESKFFTDRIDFEAKYPQVVHNPNVPLKGGRGEALKLLASLPKNYDKVRNDPNQSNSQLSPYNKFGCLSIREFFHASREEALTRQLYWRDFYYHICVMNGGYESFQKKYRDLKWENNPKYLQAWKEGKTGTPIVDAAMRCLATTGIMHNRLRMIVASYLTKDLLIDWKEGEKHFAHYLVDYDPAQNNGGWQWASSTGTDPQPYFRIFNPELQSKTHDPDCRFIRKWIPELKNVSTKDIHGWEREYIAYKGLYCPPIIIHKEQKEKSLSLFKSYGGYGGETKQPESDEDSNEPKQPKSKPKPNKRSTTQQKGQISLEKYRQK